MIRLTYYITLALIIALGAAWVSSNPGNILITWQGWEIRFSIAFLILIIILYTVLLWMFLRLLKRFNILSYFSSPKRMAAKRSKAEQDLDMAWSSYALGDYKEAKKFGLRAKSNIGEDHNVMRLLASVARRTHEKENPFIEKLKAMPATAPWVKKQELDAYLDQKALPEAKAHIQEMLNSHPKNAYLLEHNFLVCAAMGNWNEASIALQNAAKEKTVFSSNQHKHYKAVIDYSIAIEKKAAGNKTDSLALLHSALKNDPSFSPAAISTARAYIEQADKKSAEKIIQSAWKIAPNNTLADMALELYPEESSNATFQRINKLTNSAPDLIESAHLLARAAIDAEKWPEAKQALENIAGASKGTRKTFELLSILERKQKNDHAAADKLMAQSEQAKPDNVWKCGSCKTNAEHYNAICKSCYAFDKIIWTGNET